jgi:transporter family protein
LFLVLSGLATGASWLCYFRALQLGDASRVAPVDKLSAVIAMALAAGFLGEHLTWRHLVGGALIVTGSVFLARVGGRARPNRRVLIAIQTRWLHATSGIGSAP